MNSLISALAFSGVVETGASGCADHVSVRGWIGASVSAFIVAGSTGNDRCCCTTRHLPSIFLNASSTRTFMANLVPSFITV